MKYRIHFHITKFVELFLYIKISFLTEQVGLVRFELKNINGHPRLSSSTTLYCYHSMRASCLERLELLDPKDRRRKYRKVSSNIANNNDNNVFLDDENEVMDQNTVSGKLTEISQRFPNHRHHTRHVFHLQLDSKETFRCYYRNRSRKLERLVSLYRC